MRPSMKVTISRFAVVSAKGLMPHFLDWESVSSPSARQVLVLSVMVMAAGSCWNAEVASS